MKAPPGKGEVDDLPGGGDGIEGLEGFEEDRPLLADVPRFAEGMAEGPMEVDAARRAYLLGVLAHDGNADGGDAGFLDGPLHQSHGLIAETSGRGQQDQGRHPPRAGGRKPREARFPVRVARCGPLMWPMKL